MSPLRSQTLIRPSSSFRRLLSTLPDGSSRLVAEDSDTKAVEKIEDVIHSFIVRRSRPDWLTFVPGSSYWVPPRRSSYGVAEIVDTLANSLTEEEYLSLTSIQGWPSSAFYIHNETCSPHLELTGAEIEVSTTVTSDVEEDSV